MYSTYGNYIGPSVEENVFSSYGYPTMGNSAQSTSNLFKQNNFGSNLQSGFTNSFAAQPALVNSTSAATTSTPTGGFNFKNQNPNNLITQVGDSSAGPGNMLGTAASLATKLNPTLAAATGVLGGIQTIGGLIGLAATKEPDKYSLTARNKAAILDSENQAKFGLSPQQMSTATQGAREQLNTDIYNARNIGGNSASRAIFGFNRGMNLRRMNDLSIADFNAMDSKRRYRDSMYQMEQGIQDRNTAMDWNVYNQKQQAYGGAMKAGTENLAGYFNLAQALKLT
jgi:hypothetical protein